MNQPWDWAILPRLTTRKRSKDIRPYTGRQHYGHGHFAGRKRFESNQDDANTKRIPEPTANALRPVAQERDQTTSEMH